MLIGSYRFAELGSIDDLHCWQAYVEGASFVRWMVATHGWSAFWQFYEETKQFGLTEANAQTLEQAWLTNLRRKKIKPAQRRVAQTGAGGRKACAIPTAFSAFRKPRP